MLLLVVIAGVLVAIGLGLAWKRKTYWQERGVVGPEATLLLGNLDELGNQVNTQQPVILQNWTRKYGNVYGILRGWKPALVIADHELANQILLQRFEEFHGRDHPPIFGNEDYEPVANTFLARGKRWRRLRAISATAFSNKNLRIMFSQLTTCSDMFMEELRSEIKTNGNEVNIKTNFHEFAANVLFRVAIAEPKTYEEIQTFIPSISKLVKMPGSCVQFTSWMMPIASKFLKIFQLFQMILCNFGILKLLYRINKKIKVRREENKQNADEQKDPVDFLDIFLKNESADVKLENNKLFDKRNDKIVKALNHTEILGMTFMFLFAGYDTVASALSFMAYYLAINPDVQEKLRDEIEQNCGSDQELSFDQLQSLNYLDAVVKETLRLQPIGASVTTRKAAHATQINGIQIEEDTHVLIDVLSIHKDSKLWGEDVDEFRPERWLDDDGKKLMSHFYGFGGGARICVGMKLAYNELRLIMVKLLQNYRIKPTSRINETMKITGQVAGPKAVHVLLERV